MKKLFRKSEVAVPPQPQQQEPAQAQSDDGSDRRSLSQRMLKSVSKKLGGGVGTRGGAFEDAMDAVIPAVVVLQMTYVRAFDGNGRGSGGATGFVIDKTRGLILTNRHVVTGAPMTVQAVFQSKEEVEVHPVYSDPIHDWGLLKFDPKDVKFQELAEVPLAPERAKVGVDIRVCGNDAGEKLAILSGTLARIDRNAPLYGGTYSDHNTFYLSAASNTSGGSSGSPVVDSEGYAVGLNAGGAFFAASSFYLPLDRVVTSLPFIKRGELPPRRTIQTVFTHESFVEVQRLGVPDEEQAKVRKQFPRNMGMLVVKKVVPESSAAEAGLSPGDVLLRLNGERVVSFVAFEEAVDNSKADKPITLEVQRGDKTLQLSIVSEDLHELTPSEMLEISDGTLHALSYMQAVSSHRPPGSVVVAAPGYMLNRAGVPPSVVIKAVGDQPTPDLETFAKEMAKYGTRDSVSISFTGLSDKHRKQVKAVVVDRSWFPWARRVRVFRDGVSVWEEKPWPGLEDSDSKKRKSGKRKSKSKSGKKDEARVVQVLEGEDPRLCTVEFQCPIFIAEVLGESYVGAGSIVDAANGIVVVDRNTVPCALGDVTVTIAGTIELPGKVLMVHPLHNFALVQYDASKVRLEISDDEAAQQPLQFDRVSPVELKPGMRTTFRGFTYDSSGTQQVSQRASVTLVKALPATTAAMDQFAGFAFAMGFDLGGSQGAKNQTVIQLDNNVGNIGGVLLDEEGLLQAFWFDFWGPKYGVNASVVLDAVARFRAGDPVRSLAAELSTLQLAKAVSGLGLGDHWVREFAALSAQRQVLAVATVMVGSNSDKRLSPGDLLLAVDGKPVADYRAAELAAADSDEVTVTVLRDGKEVDEVVRTTRLPYTGTARVVVWAGAILQSTPLDMAFRGHLPEACKGQGVYCANLRPGSPAGLYGVRPMTFVTAVNDEPTPDLDALLRATRDVEHGKFVRVQLTTVDGNQSVVTLRTDDKYWPVEELTYDEESKEWTFASR